MFFLVSQDLCEGGELYNYLVFGSGIKKFEEPIARYFFKQVIIIVVKGEQGLREKDAKKQSTQLLSI